MLDTEKAYLAGMFDGDGSVFMRDVPNKALGRKNVILELSFTLQSMETLEWIAERIGGTPRQSHKSHRAYTLRIGGKKVIEVLKLMEPYIITKRRQVSFVLFAYAAFFWDARGGHGSYSILTPEMIELRSLSCAIAQLLNKHDSLNFHGKSDEFSGRLTLLMQQLRDTMILSQAVEGVGSTEGATTRETSPNSNSPHERPTPLH